MPFSPRSMGFLLAVCLFGFPVWSDSGETGPTENDLAQTPGGVVADPIAGRLAERLANYESKLQKADEALLGSIDREIERVQQDTRTAVEQRLKQLESLAVIRKSFVEDGAWVGADYAGLRSTFARYERSLETAKRQAIASYEQAIKDYGRANELEKAKAVIQQFEAFKAGPKDADADAEIESVEGAVQIAAFGQGQKSQSNRRYVWTRVPEDMPFTRFSMIPGGSQTTLKVNVKRGGWLYIACDSNAHRSEHIAAFLDEGQWDKAVWTFGYSDHRRTLMQVYRKRVPRGLVTIPPMGWAGPIVLMK